MRAAWSPAYPTDNCPKIHKIKLIYLSNVPLVHQPKNPTKVFPDDRLIKSLGFICPIFLDIPTGVFQKGFYYRGLSGHSWEILWKGPNAL